VPGGINGEVLIFPHLRVGIKRKAKGVESWPVGSPAVLAGTCAAPWRNRPLEDMHPVHGHLCSL